VKVPMTGLLRRPMWGPMTPTTQLHLLLKLQLQLQLQL
jgi:hypothetical protein